LYTFLESYFNEDSGDGNDDDDDDDDEDDINDSSVNKTKGNYHVI